MAQPRIGPLCSKCAHITPSYLCRVFPKGIPDEIVDGLPHTQPYPGDGGVVFEQRKSRIRFKDLNLKPAKQAPDFK